MRKLTDFRHHVKISRDGSLMQVPQVGDAPNSYRFFAGINLSWLDRIARKKWQFVGRFLIQDLLSLVFPSPNAMFNEILKQ
jgi:hypothetical protein